jgi:hypothetical protein
MPIDSELIRILVDNLPPSTISFIIGGLLAAIMARYMFLERRDAPKDPSASADKDLPMRVLAIEIELKYITEAVKELKQAKRERE